MSSTPIADHALLSDAHGSALVSREGSVDWLCFGRFDAPPLMCRILDDEAGHFSIAPAGSAEATRTYLDDTMVLATSFRTPTGEVTVEDALAMGPGEGHDLGRDAPGALVRRVTCTSGTVELDVTFAPRPEFGLIHPLTWAEDGGIRSRGGANRLVLSTPVQFRIEGSTARARVELNAGERTTFALRHRWSWETPAEPITQERAEALLDETIASWRSWSGVHRRFEGPYADLVRLSGRVLQALTFQPTGAMVAAPTTSLPESVGGERNWDYRYAWVRDASFTLQALYHSTCPDEAHRFFEWMAGASAAALRSGRELQIMFGVGGEHDLSERELPHLAGYRGSRPVRVGNGAWDQRQLDVYGELLDAALFYASQFDLDDVTHRFLADAADAAAARWQEEDEGIWEVRGGRRHFVYSKLMCWVALDRAIALADGIGAGDRAAEWARARDEIRRAIESRGWSDRAGAFAQAFGSDDLDASVLMLPIVGFLEPGDPLVVATLDAIEQGLTDDRGLVYRYRASDGLEGDEGTFLLCTFWLAQAQAMAGRVAQARATFERAAAHVNDLGLLAEEVDPGTGELLGNFPQAFSHIGLINAAAAIAAAEAGVSRSGAQE
jgi:GH15 family glucan-1,4-alpha-glucosidase